MDRKGCRFFGGGKGLCIKKKKQTILGSILFYIGLLVLWQIVFWMGTEVLAIWESYTFPSIVGIIERFFELWKDGTIAESIGYSLGRGVIGYIISCIIGCIVGAVILNVKYLNTYLKPMLMGIQTLPSICWVPFAILWFGLGENSILFVIIMGSALSIALLVESSVRNVDKIYVQAASTMGAKGIKMLYKVIIPAAIPMLISGFRQGWSFAWRALMAGEVISSSVGLGYTLMVGRNLADINQVMLVMIIIVIIGIIVDKVFFSFIEKRVLRKRGVYIG